MKERERERARERERESERVCKWCVRGDGGGSARLFVCVNE